MQKLPKPTEKKKKAEIKTPALETQRLILKEVNPKIADELFTTLSDNELMTFFGFTDPDDLRLEKFKWQNGMTTYRMTYKRFFLTEKATGKVFGSCSLHNWYPEHRRSELGYDINDETMKNKGFMKEAVKTVLTFGFEKMGLNRVEAFIGPANEPSLRIANRLGFTEEGRLREHYNKDGELQDSIVFGLLKPEYEKVKKTWTKE
ncbi:MAG: acetyltransferase, ribosomal protein N-acetylase [Flavipsychrobacter sp.]|jgi:ribosomal-protein-alanine N-acetyltransferase|nr:acetyltransferase, ribosomal protein N-acetylase [Flavipsychrobacter sp.]